MEYMEKHSVARMIGAPPGYVGYDEGGQLSEAVRRKPYSVVLFDEIEKAHPDVFNVLLQVLDDGRITDSQGRTVDFKNTVIIMTSNIGSRHLLEGVEGNEIKESTREAVMADLRQHFRPEFLNRVDEVVVFRQLTREDLLRVVDLEVAKIQGRLADRQIELVLDDAAKAFLLDTGYRAEYGARQLRRAVERHLEDPLSEEILRGTYVGRCRIHARVEEGKLVFQARKLPARRTAQSKD